MNGRLCQAVAVVLALATLVSLAADLMLKDHADLDQVFWSCYWASVTIVLGILFQRDGLVSSGLVFFIGVGLPAWILGRLLDEGLYPTSVLIHTVPVMAAVVYLAGKGPVRRYSALGAWVLHLVPLLLARFFTDPQKNINLAHSVWPPASWLFPHLWQFYAAMLTASTITLTITATGINAVSTHINSVSPLPGHPGSHFHSPS